MTDWKTRIVRYLVYDGAVCNGEDTVTVEEAEARIAVLERKIAALEARP
jgi:uncharacterized small protein (DUF1192 family)